MPLDNGIPLTIVADTMEEVRIKLRKAYGQNYELLDKRTEFRRTGLFGLKQKEVQVVSYKTTQPKEEEKLVRYEDRRKEQEQLEQNRKDLLEKFQNEFNNSKKLNELSTKMDEISKALQNNNLQNQDEHPNITKIEELLVQNEFSLPYIKMINQKIKEQFTVGQLEDFKLIERYVVDWIGESIQIYEEKHVRPPKVVIIVGPTGVGKTTTIAKLASNSILDAKTKGDRKPELCILTIDTMRVGALEQLSKFGEILGKSVLKAENADDVREIYEEYKEHVDYIFIDTSGYSPNDTQHISSMKTILDVKMNTQVFLSVTASTKISDLQNILRNFEPFAYESVIVTKCDESEQLGNIISVLWDKHKSIAYMTDGQRAPKNIKKANIVDILINLNGFDIDRIHIEDKFGEK